MEDNQSFLDLQIDDQTSVQLNETSRWAKFLGIAVLIALGLTLLMFGVFWSRIDPLLAMYDDAAEGASRIVKVMILVVLVIVVVISVVLMTFLIRGANAIRTAIRNKDAAMLNVGLGNFRNYFAIMGVLGIIGLFFSIIGFFSR
ncbi:MAG: hypothetical protein EOO01_10220 [Chitinophagaceae bacterium]|nr:MAG: hypothetical protein EOO01_10220 [Chitinophagaceae bacterium]